MKQSRQFPSKAGLKKVVEDCDTDIDQHSNKVNFGKNKRNDSTLDTINVSGTTLVKDKLEDLKISDKAIPEEEDSSSLVRQLQRALLEVVDQNQKLKQMVEQLETQNTQLREEMDVKDQAIVELAALLDQKMGGELTEALAEI